MNLEPWIEFDKRRGTHQVRWRDAAGIKHRDEFRFRDKASATARKKQVWDLLERKALGKVDDTRTPQACVDAFLEDQVGQKCDHRLETSYTYALKHFFAMDGLSSMRDVTRPKILEFKSFLFGKKFTDQTIATYMRALGCFLKWAKDREWISENPFVDIEVPTPKQIDRFFTDEEIAAFERVIDNEDFRCIFRLGYMVGLRPAEILRIRSEHLLYIEDKERWVLVISPDETKTSRGRSVAVPMQVMECLPKRKGLIFAEWTEQRKKRHFWKAKKRAGIEDRVLKNGRRIVKIFYWTRHTYARQFLQRRGRIEVLQMLMGHASSKLTIDTYGHLEKSYVLDQAHEMNDIAGQLAGQSCGANAGQAGQNCGTIAVHLKQGETNKTTRTNGLSDEEFVFY